MVVSAVIAVGVISALTSHYAGQSWGVLAAVVAGLIATFTLIVVALRLSMAAPMTFADGGFACFDGVDRATPGRSSRRAFAVRDPDRRHGGADRRATDAVSAVLRLRDEPARL